MSRQTAAVINIAHFRANCRLAKQYAGGAKMLAIVKANGYGHGAIRLANAADAADAFGVATIDEAVELRDAGVAKPIVLLEGFFESSDLREISRRRCDIVVHSQQQAEALLASQLAQPLVVWLKLDSGMHRLGFAAAAFREAHACLSASANVREIRLMSHFACADQPDHPFVAEQLAGFEQAVVGISGAVSLANSAALVAQAQARRDWVRPGIMLYGANPFVDRHPVAAELRAVMTLSSRLIAVRTIAPGESVGYGCAWRSERTSRIGTVAIGYGDGYPRHARSGTPLLIRGRRAPLVGRVSMDMITVDLTDLPQAQVGDSVTLWGEGLPAWEVAAWADTLAYDLFTGIGRRVTRHYTGE